MKKLTFLLSFTLFSLFQFTSCKDKLTPCELLEGDWQCESWKEDGVEQLGSLAYLSYSKLDFDELSGDKGDFDWTVNYNDGTSEVISGKYEVNSSCSEITLIFSGGDNVEFDFEVVGDELTIDGNLDGIGVEIDFKRD